jgi:membrane protease YdiL (CAAX protease family)
MALVDAQTLTVVECLLNGIGVACALGFARTLVRTGEWRAPLGRLPPRGAEPDPLALAAVAIGYVLLTTPLLRLLVRDVKTLETPGSSDWHVAQSVDAAAKLVFSTLIVLILAAARRTAGAPASPPGWRTQIRVAFATAFILLPVCTSQLYAAKILWRYLDPSAEQPQHGVIDALERSEWGSAGIVQLVLVAVVVAPLAEELFFRGLLLGAARRVSGLAWPAILLSAAAFGIVHLPQPQNVVPLTTMGIILGYVRLRYDSVWVCVLIHALFNLHTMAVVLLNPEMARDA